MGRIIRSRTVHCCMSIVVSALLIATTMVAHAGVDPVAKCESLKLLATGKTAQSLLKCHAKAAKKDAAVDAGCLSKAGGKLDAAFVKADSNGVCAFPGDASTIGAELDDFVALIAAALPTGATGQLCASKKLGAVAKKTAGLLKAAAKDRKKPSAEKFASGVGKTELKFVGPFDNEEPSGNCETNGDRAPINKDVDDFVKTILGIVDPACPQQLVYSPEGNRLHRYDLDTIDNPPLVQDILIPSSDDDPSGRDINGQICERPGVAGGFISGEDTNQPMPPPGWGVFDADGTQVGKLTATYFSALGDPFGCAFDPSGNLFTSDIGNDALGDLNGQLTMWFAPFDSFPGLPGEFPNTNDPSTNFCKITSDIGTAGSVATDELGRVYVTSARGFNVRRFSPPFPTAPNAGGGCGQVDALGSPLADSVNEDVFVSDPLHVGTPTGIVRAPNGDWYISSVLAGRIAEYDADGNYVRAILTPLATDTTLPLTYGHPQGLAVDCRGNLYYADLALVDTGGGLGGIGPGPNGTVRRITFDIAGNPRVPDTINAGLAYPDALGVMDGDLEMP